MPTARSSFVSSSWQQRPRPGTRQRQHDRSVRRRRQSTHVSPCFPGGLWLSSHCRVHKTVAPCILAYCSSLTHAHPDLVGPVVCLWPDNIRPPMSTAARARAFTTKPHDTTTLGSNDHRCRRDPCFSLLVAKFPSVQFFLSFRADPGTSTRCPESREPLVHEQARGTFLLL